MLDISLYSKANTLEIAIAGYKVTQKLYAHKPLSKEYTWIQYKLGCAYNYRIKGERAENLELAIETFKLAVTVHNRENFPEQWVLIQKSIGIVYSYRIRGNKANNLRKAIKSFKLASRVCNSNHLPELWAKIQNEMGNIYLKIEKEGKVDSLLKEAAIKAFESALNVLSRENNPYDWAITQNHLGSAYMKRIQGNKNENLENSVKAFESALEIFDKTDNEYGRSKNNLSKVYLQRKDGDRKENLKLAIQALESALQIYVNDYLPQELAVALYSIGEAYLISEEYTKAYDAFAISIKIADFLRWEIIFGSGCEADKQNLAEEWSRDYQGMVKACLNLAKCHPHYFADAIEYAELSKARNLTERLHKEKLYSQRNSYNLNKKYQRYCKNLENLQAEILKKEWQQKSKEKLKILLGSSNNLIQNTEIDREYIKIIKMIRKRDQLIQKINKIAPNIKFNQILNGIAFSEIKALVDQNTAIIEWYITNDQIIAFIITHNEDPMSEQQRLFWTSSSEDLDSLTQKCQKYFEVYYAPRLKKHKGDDDKQKELKEQWQSGLNTHLQQLADILHIKDIISLIPENVNRLILVPHRFLHLLPLHALPLPEQQDKCLLDKFNGGISYTPSCQLLQISQELERNKFSHLFAVQNPTDDLMYADLEVGTLRNLELFSSSEVLEKENASKVALKVSENLPLSHCCHFACHGKFDLKSPVDSALLLSEYKSSATEKQTEKDGRLTLTEIFELTLDQCRLVTLSACETGMVDPDTISDEYVGLPSGFMFAGSPSVVASLWKTDDSSTAFLMIKFYENLTEHRQKFDQLEEGAVALALNQAQCWLRDATNTELMQKMENLSLKRTQKSNLIRFFNTNGEKPYSNPYYWAAFCAIGK